MIAVKANFATAKELRKKASECKSYQVAKKIELADKALDSMELVIGGLIEEVESMRNG